MTTEDIVARVGDHGRFQLFILTVMYGPRLLMSYSMLMMSFAGVAPKWWCVPHTTPDLRTNNTFEMCPDTSNKTCDFEYSDDMTTIVSEWDLVCDRETLSTTVTSVQMGGVLIGALASGQSADVIGRKKTYYVVMLLHALLNVVAAFSTSWEMFIALRFFIGFMIGGMLVVSFPYCMEFIGIKWRTLTATIPLWAGGVCLFAMSSYLRPDWSAQHIICGAMHVPFLLGWFIVPESMRWLAVHGQLEAAEEVVDQMCRYNRTQKPENTAQLLKQVAEQEEELRASGQKYTYIDLYRQWAMCWKSLIIQFVWVCLALVYYAIAFGAGSLAGNLFLNIFLLAVVEIPPTVATHFIMNRFGRRKTCFFFFAVASLAAFGVCITSRTAPRDQEEIIAKVLALISKLGVGTAWVAFEVFTGEIYPTVIRNLGIGAANTSARIGGIISPFVFAMGGKDLLGPFLIVGCCMGVCAVLSIVLTETVECPLQDSIEVARKQGPNDRNLDKEQITPDQNGEADLKTVNNGLDTTWQNDYTKVTRM